MLVFGIIQSWAFNYKLEQGSKVFKFKKVSEQLSFK